MAQRHHVSTGSSASLTEGHACQFLLDALPFGRVRRTGEPVRETEEPVLFGLLRLQAGFDEVDKDSIIARLASPGDRAHVLGNARWKRDALANGLLWFGHMLNDTPLCTGLHHGPATRRSAREEKSLGSSRQETSGRRVRGRPELHKTQR